MTPLEVRGDGVTIRVSVDGDAIAAVTPAPSLPDVSRLPGASVVGVASHERGGLRVLLGCVRAPSDKWVPGLQSVIFERATPMILGAASLSPTLSRGPAPAASGASFTEAHRGTDHDRDVVVAHALAFVGPGADALACSVACSAPRDAAGRCEDVARSLALEGDLRPEPPPGLVARAVLGSASHPTAALALASALGVAVVALLLVTRPRLRPTARARARPRSRGSR